MYTPCTSITHIRKDHAILGRQMAYTLLTAGYVLEIFLFLTALAAQRGNPIPEKPIVFFKPTSAYIEEGEDIKYPPECLDMSHEVELGIVIGSRAQSISEECAMDCVAGYALCLDMASWDFQCAAKKDGHPWGLAKGFDTSCPVSKFIPKDQIPDIGSVRLWLKLDGVTKQDSSTSDMIFTVPQVLSFISKYFTLEPGDLVLTGSPAGAGSVLRGQVIQAGLDVGGINNTTMVFEVK